MVNFHHLPVSALVVPPGPTARTCQKYDTRLASPLMVTDVEVPVLTHVALQVLLFEVS